MLDAVMWLRTALGWCIIVQLVHPVDIQVQVDSHFLFLKRHFAVPYCTVASRPMLRWWELPYSSVLNGELSELRHFDLRWRQQFNRKPHCVSIRKAAREKARQALLYRSPETNIAVDTGTGTLNGAMRVPKDSLTNVTKYGRYY